MSEQTVIHLLRHGKVHNPDGILYGTATGYVLADSGHHMARAVASALAGQDICLVAASSLERAQQTAAPVADAAGLAIVTDDRLIEATNIFAGGRVGTQLRRPANWRYLLKPTQPSWGERYLVIARRMLAALSDAERTARGRVAVLVSHQLPIWTLRRYLQGRRLWHNPVHRECGLASLTSFVFDECGVLQRISYTEPAAHIQPTDGIAP